MDTRNEWLDNEINSLYLTTEETILDVKSNFDIRRYNSNEGFLVKIDDIETQVIIQSHLNPLNRDKTDNIIHIPVESLVKTGSIVEWDNEKWIVISDIDNLKAYKSANIQKSNNTLLFYPPNPNETSLLYELISIPCIVGKGSINLETNKFVSIPADENLIVCPNNTNSQYIKEQTRFILSGDAYSVIGIDKIEMPGLLNIKIKQTAIDTVDDNLDLGIANYWSHQITEPIDPPDPGEVWL